MYTCLNHTHLQCIWDYCLKKGFEMKSPQIPAEISALDSKVSIDKKQRIKMEVLQKTNRLYQTSEDLRLRTRSGSSGHSSLLDSGRSSQPSSEQTERESPERIAMVELSTNDKENLV